MKTQLHKARRSFVRQEEMLDVEDACWNLIIMLEKLTIVETGWAPDLYRHSESPPARELVYNWLQLYREIKEHE